MMPEILWYVFARKKPTNYDRCCNSRYTVEVPVDYTAWPRIFYDLCLSI
jgi:hypothetical protein